MSGSPDPLHPRRPARARFGPPALVALCGLAMGFASPAQATRYTWQFDLDANQIPNGISTSNALGQAWLDYESETDHLQVLVAWAALDGDLSGIHIHGRALPGESTRTHIFDVFGGASDLPLGIDRRTGHYESVFHLGEAHDDGVPSGAGHLPLDQALSAMTAGQAYMIFHSENWPDGELRGQLPVANVVPESSTGAMAILGVSMAAALSRRKGVAARGGSSVT